MTRWGADGYVLADWNGTTDLVSLPPGVTFTAEQASRYSWAAPTTDVRALQSPTRPTAGREPGTTTTKSGSG